MTPTPRFRSDDPPVDVVASVFVLVAGFGGACAVLVGSVAGAFGA